MYFTFCKVLAEALPALQLIVPDDSSLTHAKLDETRTLSQPIAESVASREYFLTDLGTARGKKFAGS